MAIVILNWNQLNATRRCVESCRSGQTIYVLNNGCREGQEYQGTGRAGETVLYSATNLGFAGGVNLAIATALADGASWILLLNNDATLASGADRLLLAAAEPRVAAVCPMVIDDRTDRVWSVGGRTNLRTGRVSSLFHGANADRVPVQSTDVDFGTGACILLSGAAVRELGGLDTTYFAYWEETDWCARARAAGFRIVTCPSARVRHAGGLSSTATFRLYLMVRNCLLFMRRHAGLRDWVTFIPVFLCWTLPSWAIRPMLSQPGASSSAIFRAFMWHARRRVPDAATGLPIVAASTPEDKSAGYRAALDSDLSELPTAGVGESSLGAVLSGTYREAVRARYVAVRTATSTGSLDRLEERLQSLEAVGRLTDPVARHFVVEAVRLLRIGDDAGAGAAYQAAMATLQAASATFAATDPAPTGGRDNDASGRSTAVGRTGAVGLGAVGPRVRPADRESDTGRPLHPDPPTPRYLVTAANFIVAGCYLALLAIAEVLVTFDSPLLVFPLHGGIVLLATGHIALLEQRPRSSAPHHAVTPFLLAIVLAALIRLISLTLPLATIAPAYRFVFAGGPMIVAAFLVVSAARFTMADVGLVWRKWRTQATVVLGSAALGVIEYAILRPLPMGEVPWTTAGFLPALAVGLSTGFPEELIFRGVLQTAARPLLGRWNWVYASLVFAVLHIGYRSPLDLAFVLGVGLLYGWTFERTRSIVGLSIGHGLANVVLFFVAPNLIVLRS